MSYHQHVDARHDDVFVEGVRVGILLVLQNGFLRRTTEQEMNVRASRSQCLELIKKRKLEHEARS